MRVSYDQGLQFGFGMKLAIHVAILLWCEILLADIILTYRYVCIQIHIFFRQLFPQIIKSIWLVFLKPLKSLDIIFADHHDNSA